MTHELDPSGEQLPELVDRLEGSLRAPSAAAIHAGLGQRQAARKKLAGVAAALVAVVLIGGGLFVLNANGNTTTETASGEPGAIDGIVDESLDRESTPTTTISSEPTTTTTAAPTSTAAPTTTVATTTTTDVQTTTEAPPTTAEADTTTAAPTTTEAATTTAPTTTESTTTTSTTTSSTSTSTTTSTTTTTGPAPVEPWGTVHIAGCANSSWIEFDGKRWIGHQLPPEWEGMDTVEVSIVIDVYSRMHAHDDSWRHGTFFADQGASTTECTAFEAPPDDVHISTTTTSRPRTEGEPETGGVTPAGPFPATVQPAPCENNSTLEYEGVQYISSTGSTLPAAWEGQATVEVTIIIRDDRVVATDEAGNKGIFIRFDPNAPRPALCRVWG